MFGRSSTWCWMPLAASSGLSLPSASAWSMKFGRQQLEHVDLAIEEREPARLAFLDDADLDARQRAAAACP